MMQCLLFSRSEEEREGAKMGRRRKGKIAFIRHPCLLQTPASSSPPSPPTSSFIHIRPPPLVFPHDHFGSYSALLFRSLPLFFATILIISKGAHSCRLQTCFHTRLLRAHICPSASLLAVRFVPRGDLSTFVRRLSYAGERVNGR